MAAESIFSFYSGNGHDGNLSVHTKGAIFTLEMERIFSNRYFTRLLNPLSQYSYKTFISPEGGETEAFSEEQRINFLDYIKKILKLKGVFEKSYSVGLFDWDTPEEAVGLLTEYFNIEEVIHRDSDFTSHHKAHAAGSFFSSGFEEALVISHDGGGNDGTFCVYDLKKPNPDFTQINKEEMNPYPTKYARIGNFIKEIRKLQFGDYLETKSHQHNGVSYPGKIMGLAGYGSLNKDFYERIFEYFNDGMAQNMSESYLKNFGDFKYNQFKGVQAYDLAFSAQLAFEDIFLNDFKKFLKDHKNVCLTGGGALNVLLNERLSKSYPHVNFFVQPSPGDSGLSYGMISHYVYK
jgi:carbamoyltransferase